MTKDFPYSELFSSIFFRIQTKYGEIRSISPYSVRMRGNADQNNSGYGHSLRSVLVFDFVGYFIRIFCYKKNAKTHMLLMKLLPQSKI